MATTSIDIRKGGSNNRAMTKPEAVREVRLVVDESNFGRVVEDIEYLILCRFGLEPKPCL